MERGDRPDQTAEVNRHELVIRLDGHRPRKLRVLGSGDADDGAGGADLRRLRRGQVGEEVEDVLEVAEDGVVDGEFFVDDFLQVLADVL